MRELLFGLKECEKELCYSKRVSIKENMERRDMPLPLFHGFYKQATPPKATTHSEGLKSSLNKKNEYLRNGCKLFHLEYNPLQNRCMDPFWTQFISYGRGELVLGHQSKAFVLPAPGQQDPHQITLIHWYMKFHCCYTGISRIRSHTTMTNLDKCVEITMVDGSVPPRKFTMLRQEYMDLRTSEGLDVFHVLIPRVKTASKGPLVDCLILAGNTMARDLSSKMAVCPLAWWWHSF
jgi:hypothetical protein